MSIPRDSLFRILLLIALSGVVTFTLPPQGYGDNWILVGKYQNFATYYDNTNIEINKESRQIKVLIKRVFNKEGKENIINKRKGSNLQVDNFIKLGHEVTTISYDYGEVKCNILSVTFYSKSGEILESTKNSNPQWTDIPPKSLFDIIYNKI